MLPGAPTRQKSLRKGHLSIIPSNTDRAWPKRKHFPTHPPKRSVSTCQLKLVTFQAQFSQTSAGSLQWRNGIALQCSSFWCECGSRFALTVAARKRIGEERKTHTHTQGRKTNWNKLLKFSHQVLIWHEAVVKAISSHGHPIQEPQFLGSLVGFLYPQKLARWTHM